MHNIEFCTDISVSENEEMLLVKQKAERGTDLGFTGPIVSIVSHFIPTDTDSATSWQGAVKVYALKKEVAIKHFKCEDEHQLKMQVGAYIESIINNVSAATCTF